jgi:hypothetical protein
MPELVSVTKNSFSIERRPQQAEKHTERRQRQGVGESHYKRRWPVVTDVICHGCETSFGQLRERDEGPLKEYILGRDELPKW